MYKEIDFEQQSHQFIGVVNGNNPRPLVERAICELMYEHMSSVCDNIREHIMLSFFGCNIATMKAWCPVFTNAYHEYTLEKDDGGNIIVTAKTYEKIVHVFDE